MPMGDDKIRIYRAPRDAENPYFMMRRDTAQDESISYEARGMLAYLLSKPGDWEIRRGDLMRAGRCGRDRVIRILKELVVHGYAQRLGQRRGENNKFVGVDYVIYEKPSTCFQSPGEPSPGEPSTGNPQQQSKEEKHKEQKPQPSGDERPNIFKVWEQETGTMLTPGIVDRLKDAVEKYGEEWVRDAIKTAVDNNARTWAYIRAVLERWQRDGRDAPKQVAPVAAPAAPAPPPVFVAPAPEITNTMTAEERRAELQKARAALTGGQS